MQGLLVGGGILLLLAFNVAHLYLWISMLDDLKRQLPEGMPLIMTWDPFARIRYQRQVLRLHREHFPASRKRAYWIACWALGFSALVTVAVFWLNYR